MNVTRLFIKATRKGLTFTQYVSAIVSLSDSEVSIRTYYNSDGYRKYVADRVGDKLVKVFTVDDDNRTCFSIEATFDIETGVFTQGEVSKFDLVNHAFLWKREYKK